MINTKAGSFLDASRFDSRFIPEYYFLVAGLAGAAAGLEPAAFAGAL